MPGTSEAWEDGYDCGHCGRHWDEVEPLSCTLTGDILSVEMANIIEFESTYKGEGHIFCDTRCLGAWLEPRVHRLLQVLPR